MDTRDTLMQGAIDMHMHAGPDPHTPRSVDAFQAAEEAAGAGMRAIVLKSHDYPTAPVASLTGQKTPKVKVFGSIALDFAVGGLNPAAVEASAILGAKVVWMPTFSAAHDMLKRGLGEGGIRIADEGGKALPALTRILEIAKQHGMVVATGHVGLTEIRALVREASRLGVDKVVITHAVEPRFGATLTVEQQKEMVSQGAYIEHCYLTTLPSGGQVDINDVAKAMRSVGTDCCIMTTDLGQKTNPHPAHGMRSYIGSMLDCGLTEAEVSAMAKTNPARLLGLD